MCFRQIITYTCNHERVAEDTRCPFFSHQFGCQSPMRKPLRDAFSSTTFCVSQLPFLCEVCKKKTLDEKRTEYRMKVKPGYYGYPKLEGGTATIQKEVGSSKEGGETRRTRGMDARGLMSESWRGEGRDSRSEEREPSYDDCNWSFYQATNPERPSPARYSQADLIPGQYYQLTILNNPNMAGVEDVIIRKTAAPGVQSYAGAYDRGCAQENELTIEEKNELEGRLIDFDG